jgi:hypothetical protein
MKRGTKSAALWQALSLAAMALIAGTAFALHARAPMTPYELVLAGAQIDSLAAEADATFRSRDSKQMTSPMARGHLKLVREKTSQLREHLSERRTPINLERTRSRELDKARTLIERLRAAD